jgi:hypothetical protein
MKYEIQLPYLLKSELLILSKLWLAGHLTGMEGAAEFRKYFDNLKYIKLSTSKTISGLRIMQC